MERAAVELSPHDHLKSPPLVSLFQDYHVEPKRPGEMLSTRLRPLSPAKKKQSPQNNEETIRPMTPSSLRCNTCRQ